jgi:hypothetical protein
LQRLHRVLSICISELYPHGAGLRRRDSQLPGAGSLITASVTGAHPLEE